MIIHGVFLDIVAFLIVISLIVLVHEFGHFIVAKRLGVKVEKFSLGFGPKIIGKLVGETEYVLSALPFGGYVKLLGEDPEEELPPEDEKRSYAKLPPYKKFLIIFAGPFFNFILALVIFTIFFMGGQPILKPVVGGLMKNYPAVKAGLKKGDTILSVNNIKVKSWGSLSGYIKKSGNKSLSLKILRNGKILNIVVKPKLSTVKNIFRRNVKLYLIGISPSSNAYYYKYGNIFSSFYSALQEIWFVIYVTILSIFYLLAGKIPASDLGGPIMIAQLSGKAVSMGVSKFFYFVAFISVDIGLVNLLPIPALDGGHLLFSVVEMVKRKPLSVRFQEIATQIGFALLILLLLFVTYNDIIRTIKA